MIKLKPGEAHPSGCRQPAREMREALTKIRDRIVAFDKECNKGQGTDIDAAWSLVYEIRDTANTHIKDRQNENPKTRLANLENS